MTRRSRKPAPARKVRRKSRRAEKAAPRDPLEDSVAAGACALGLTIDKSWMLAVRGHLQVTLRHAALVSAFALPDDAEPAPVFKA